MKSGSVLVDKALLQNKKDRYYFSDTIKLKENQIYISKLDLNIENNEIEQPIKPMIRISTPYYVNGQLKGIIILNYLANDILNQVKQVASTSNGNMFMLDSEGYWLYNSEDKNKEWTFMYKDKADISFCNEFPTEWKSIRQKKDGYQISENGVFIYSNIITSQAFTEENHGYSYVWGSGDWVLISYMSADSQIGKLFNENLWTMLLHILQTNYYIYILILLSSITIATLIVVNINKREQIKINLLSFINTNNL